LFTGIIEEVGRVSSIVRDGSGAKVAIHARIANDGVKLGDSIAVNGVCLSVTSLTPAGFTADATPQTMSATNLGSLSCGSHVNLERAVTPSTRLGGHIVSGHVDCICRVAKIQTKDNSQVITFDVDDPLSMNFIVARGSVTVNGISLTVASVDTEACTFNVSAIPITLADTNLAFARVGDTANLETDILAKYVAAFLKNEVLSLRTQTESVPSQKNGEGVAGSSSGDGYTSGITLEHLQELGF
jgi:riboflavin synthase